MELEPQEPSNNADWPSPFSEEESTPKSSESPFSKTGGTIFTAERPDNVALRISVVGLAVNTLGGVGNHIIGNEKVVYAAIAGGILGGIVAIRNRGAIRDILPTPN